MKATAADCKRVAAGVRKAGVALRGEVRGLVARQRAEHAALLRVLCPRGAPTAGDRQTAEGEAYLLEHAPALVPLWRELAPDIEAGGDTATALEVFIDVVEQRPQDVVAALEATGVDVADQAEARAPVEETPVVVAPVAHSDRPWTVGDSRHEVARPDWYNTDERVKKLVKQRTDHRANRSPAARRPGPELNLFVQQEAELDRRIADRIRGLDEGYDSGRTKNPARTPRARKGKAPKATGSAAAASLRETMQQVASGRLTVAGMTDRCRAGRALLQAFTQDRGAVVRRLVDVRQADLVEAKMRACGAGKAAVRAKFDGQIAKLEAELEALAPKIEAAEQRERGDKRGKLPELPRAIQDELIEGVLLALEPGLVPFWRRMGAMIEGATLMARFDTFLAFAADAESEAGPMLAAEGPALAKQLDSLGEAPVLPQSIKESEPEPVAPVVEAEWEDPRDVRIRLEGEARDVSNARIRNDPEAAELGQMSRDLTKTLWAMERDPSTPKEELLRVRLRGHELNDALQKRIAAIKGSGESAEPVVPVVDAPPAPVAAIANEWNDPDAPPMPYLNRPLAEVLQSDDETQRWQIASDGARAELVMARDRGADPDRLRAIRDRMDAYTRALLRRSGPIVEAWNRVHGRAAEAPPAPSPAPVRLMPDGLPPLTSMKDTVRRDKALWGLQRQEEDARVYMMTPAGSKDGYLRRTSQEAYENAKRRREERERLLERAWMDLTRIDRPGTAPEPYIAATGYDVDRPTRPRAPVEPSTVYTAPPEPVAQPAPVERPATALAAMSADPELQRLKRSAQWSLESLRQQEIRGNAPVARRAYQEELDRIAAREEEIARPYREAAGLGTFEEYAKGDTTLRGLRRRVANAEGKATLPPQAHPATVRAARNRLGRARAELDTYERQIRDRWRRGEPLSVVTKAQRVARALAPVAVEKRRDQDRSPLVTVVVEGSKMYFGGDPLDEATRAEIEAATRAVLDSLTDEQRRSVDQYAADDTRAKFGLAPLVAGWLNQRRQPADRKRFFWAQHGPGVARRKAWAAGEWWGIGNDGTLTALPVGMAAGTWSFKEAKQVVATLDRLVPLEWGLTADQIVTLSNKRAVGKPGGVNPLTWLVNRDREGRTENPSATVGVHSDVRSDSATRALVF